jgi:hypothetical protein
VSCAFVRWGEVWALCACAENASCAFCKRRWYRLMFMC